MNRKLVLLSGMAVAVAGFSAYASFDRMFGYPGQNGGDGITGSHGRSYGAQAITVAANARPVAYDFSGADGGDGGNGAYGTAASNCYTRYDLDEDLQGAPGGSGGDAGAGGDGGDGANVTVTYTPRASGSALADLKNVALDLSGGAPGRSGYAGAGQAGCSCARSRWTVIRRVPVTRRVCQTPPPRPVPSPAPSPAPSPLPPPQPVCHDVIDYVDQAVTHYCTDGRDGSSGSVPQGSYGTTGRVTLVPTTKPTDSDFPNASAAVGQLPFATTLTQDNWATASGAQALFAQGSRLSDTYRFYAGRTISPVRIAWNAKRGTSDLAGIVFGLHLNGGVLSESHDSSQIWAAVSKRADASGTTFSIDAAAKPSEALRVSATLSGKDGNTILTLKDAEGLSDLISTGAFAKIESKGIFWHTNFEGSVPSNQIEVRSPSEIIIYVGRFYPADHMGDLRADKKIKITLTINRSLGNDSASQAPIVIEQKLK